MRPFTNSEKLIIEYLVKHSGKWIAPSVIARNADKDEHCCSWASHICLRLTDNGILEHNVLGQYCYNEGTSDKSTESKLNLKPSALLRSKVTGYELHQPKAPPKFHRNIEILTCTQVDSKKTIRPLKPHETGVDLKCTNGDLYTISTLANGLQIKKNSENDEKISISTCKGDRIIIGDNTVYIY